MEGNSTGTGVNASSAVSAEVSQPQNTGAEVNTSGNVPDAEGQTGAEEVTLDSFFEKYPELKKENDKRTQKTVQSRVHQMNKSMQRKNDVIDKLMVAQGLKSFEELEKSLESSLVKEFSIKHGVDDDLGQEMFNLRLEKKRTDDRDEYFSRIEKAEKQYSAWEDEAKELKKLYPNMDLEEEFKNPRFMQYLTATDPQYQMSMQEIYEMIHHKEIVEATKKSAAAAYAQSVNANISRPVENGAGNQSAVSMPEVSKLTKKQRAELAERAMRGEKISF